MDIGHGVTDVVQELVENSIDAGASCISIFLENGGYSLISVKDNGCGIRPSELPHVCNYHTTTKMTDYNLEYKTLETFGFHGSSLAHFSCMSKITISSRQKNEMSATSGMFLFTVMTQSRIILDHPVGTTVEVVDHLYNYPELRESRNKNEIEVNKVVKLVSKYAVAYPTISFQVSSNRCPDQLKTNGNSTFSEMLRALHKAEAANSFISCSADIHDLGKADIFFANPKMSHQFQISRDIYTSTPFRAVFLNGKLITSQTIKQAVDQVFVENCKKKNKQTSFIVMLQFKPDFMPNVLLTKKALNSPFEMRIKEFIKDCILKELDQLQSDSPYHAKSTSKIEESIGKGVKQIHQIEHAPKSKNKHQKQAYVIEKPPEVNEPEIAPKPQAFYQTNIQTPPGPKKATLKKVPVSMIQQNMQQIPIPAQFNPHAMIQMQQQNPMQHMQMQQVPFANMGVIDMGNQMYYTSINQIQPMARYQDQSGNVQPGNVAMSMGNTINQENAPVISIPPSYQQYNPQYEMNLQEMTMGMRPNQMPPNMGRNMKKPNYQNGMMNQK